MSNLREHGLPVQRDDGALIAVHRDARVVETLFRVTQLVSEVRDAAFEDTPEVSRDQRSTDAYRNEVYVLGSEACSIVFYD